MELLEEISDGTALVQAFLLELDERNHVEKPFFDQCCGQMRMMIQRLKGA